MLPRKRAKGRRRFPPQKDQTGRKRQEKSDRAVGPQNDSEREKRPAMERERSCCRGENVIKYPSSWENAPAPAGVGNRLSRFCRRGSRTEFADTAAGAHPRVASFGLRPIHLQLPPYRVTLIRPSASSAPVCALGHLPPGRGKAGRAADSRPYGVYRSHPSFS